MVRIEAAELSGAFGELDRAIGDNAEQAQVRLIGGIALAWDDTDEQQKKRFRSQLAQALESDNVAIKRAVFESLPSLRGGPKNSYAKASTKTLVQKLSVMRHTMHAKDNDLTIVGLQSLGKLQHVSGLAMLFDHLTHKEPAVVAAAVAALGDYEDGKLDHRKLIFTKILESAADQDGAVAAAVDKTLARITNRSLRGKRAWTVWWNSEGQNLAAW